MNVLRWVAVFVALEAALFAAWHLTGCAPVSSVAHTPAPMGHWASDVPTIDLRLSAALTPCQRASVYAAAEWWRVAADRPLFTLRMVARDDGAVVGLPRYGQVGVAPGAMIRPDVLDETRVDTVPSGLPGYPPTLRSASVTLQGCSVRSYAHELGHVLGLAHRDQAGALMQPITAEDAWMVTAGEVAIARREWWALGEH